MRMRVTDWAGGTSGWQRHGRSWWLSPVKKRTK